MSSYGGSIHLRRRDAGLAERAMGHDSPLRRLDWVLLLAVAALIGMGSLLVWSATRQRMLDADLDPASFLKRHLINAAIGLALASVASLVD